MTKPKLAVIFPSRGLVFSETIEELLRELAGIDHQIFFAHGLSLPECFNAPIEEAMNDKSFTHILICEDDMILPKGILKKMLKEDYLVVALDYPFKENDQATVLRDPEGWGFYSGTGLLLVQRLIFEKLPKPYFQTGVFWEMIIRKGGLLEFWPHDVSDKKRYGLHDMNFGMTLYANGIRTLVMPEVAGQRKLRELGKPNTNQGAHDIYELRGVVENNVIQAEDQLEVFLRAMKGVSGVKISTTTPDDIVYVNGKATLKQ
jgi:hypothetical protein